MAAVNANVIVRDPETDEVVFVAAGDEPPKRIRDLLGEHLFTGDSAGQDGPPPQSGKGSGRDAWAAYAEAHGVAVDEDANRDQIVADLEAAGVPVE
jgi:hypothetical protein